MSDKMMLQTLHINRGYGKDAELTGEITFTTEHGSVQLQLTKDEVRPILEHCAEAVVASVKRVAECLTADALATTAIEHKSEDAKD